MFVFYSRAWLISMSKMKTISWNNFVCLHFWLTSGLSSLFCGVSLMDNHVLYPSLSVVPYWLWVGEEVPRQPNKTAHPLQRRQEPDWHSTLCLHQCAPGHWTEVCAHFNIWFLKTTWKKYGFPFRNQFQVFFSLPWSYQQAFNQLFSFLFFFVLFFLNPVIEIYT